MFRRLSTRLTVLYAGLFGAVLLVVSLAVFLAIAGAAERQVKSELAATGTVFDRVWSRRPTRPASRRRSTSPRTPPASSCSALSPTSS
jgi:diguanylate cyclase